MSRVLHPSYFPAQRASSSCQHWGQFDIPLEKKMEAYWRVKKWSIFITATFNSGNSATGASGVLDVSSRGSETNLVCEGYVSKQLVPSGEMIDASAAIGSDGFSIDGVSFDDILLYWPGNIVANLPVTLKIGDYEKITYASLSTAGPLDSSGGIVEAIEWWPYEDASGNPLYNKFTGKPI